MSIEGRDATAQIKRLLEKKGKGLEKKRAARGGPSSSAPMRQAVAVCPA
jgi:hypothetical protein